MLNRSNLGQLLVGGVMAALVFACTADAVQTNSTPNAALIAYSLAPGAVTASYAPASNQATLIMGTCTTSGDRGVGQATVMRVPNAFVEWAGINSDSNGAVSHGFSGSESAHIIQIDFSGQVWLEVGNLGGSGNGTRDTVRVHNLSTGISYAGNTTWIW